VDAEAPVGREGLEELPGGERRVALLGGGEEEVEEGHGPPVPREGLVEAVEGGWIEAHHHRLEGPREVGLGPAEGEQGVEHQVLDLAVPRAHAVERGEHLQGLGGLGAPKVGAADLAPDGVLRGFGVAVGQGVGEGHRGSPFRVGLRVGTPAWGPLPVRRKNGAAIAHPIVEGDRNQRSAGE
jgi:hypothetical protein